ncbi:MAG: HD domain-containing protein, partial [Chloroflexi bacterium]|nr:HD domain-containing protein [Chloroflexota bacterium]
MDELEGAARRKDWDQFVRTFLLAGPKMPPQEVNAMQGVEQPPQFHPEGDVFIHTMILLEKLQAPTPTLAMGALLHDVGKPAGSTVEDSGRIRFLGHHQIGAQVSAQVLTRLRFSRRGAELVSRMVEHHLRPSQMAQNGELPS